MGTWFTKYFAGQKHRVSVHDTDKKSLNKLKRYRVNMIDDLKFTIMDSDLVIVCVPINSMKRVLLQVSKYMMIDATLVEISSVKHEAHKTLSEVARMYKLKPLCVHPFFGPGADSMKGMKVALIPVFDAHEEERKAKKLFRSASLVTVDVKDHDKMVAIILGLTHLNNAVLAKIISDEKEPNRLKDIAGSTYKIQSLLTESIMNDEPSLFTSLLTANPYVKRYAKSLLEATEQLCKYVIDENPRGLSRAYLKIKDKMEKEVKLDKSYEKMYEVLKILK